MKTRVWGLVGSLIFGLGCGTSEQARMVKTYQDGLGAMLEKNEVDVVRQLVDGWKFELFKVWEAQNPDVETVLKNNFRSYGFSREEAKNLFAAEGKYKVGIYLKMLGSELVTSGQISAGGNSILGTADRQTNRDYAYVRVVFKDKKLIHRRIWS
jgi:hypothetical protein